MSEPANKNEKAEISGPVLRSKRQMKSSLAVGAFQKRWFQNLHERVKQGEPFAICNADEAEEIFVAMDIPVVQRQWWSAIISAKRMSPRYFDVLDTKGYDVCRYCVLGLGCTLDNKPEEAPWGGLPRPTVIIGSTECDSSLRIMERWAKEYTCALFPLEISYSAPRKPMPKNWWEHITDQWDEILDPEKIDLKVEELKALIRFLEVNTGKTFSMAKLHEVAERINEQNEYSRKADELIVKAFPYPVSSPDLSASYPIQWQRGSPEARDLAKAVYEEIKERIANGEAAYAGEKIRLSYLGMGLWTNQAFFQYFEEQYGAIFINQITTMAGHLYPRKILNNDPLRAIASRLVTLGGGNDFNIWSMKRLNVRGIVQQVGSKHCRRPAETPLTKMAMEKAGIPVLSIPADNVNAKEWDDTKIRSLVSDFIEKRLLS